MGSAQWPGARGSAPWWPALAFSALFALWVPSTAAKAPSLALLLGPQPCGSCQDLLEKSGPPPSPSHQPLATVLPPPRSPVFPAPPGPSSCSCAVLIGMTPHLLPGAAGTKNLRLGSSNHRNLFSPSPGGQNCERKVSAGLVPSEAYWGHCPRALSSLWALPTVSGSSALASTRSLPSSSQRSPCVCMCWCPDVSS